jgi:LEA14-like dessication related protein
VPWWENLKNSDLKFCLQWENLVNCAKVLTSANSMRNLLIAGAVIAGVYYLTKLRALTSLQFVPRGVSLASGAMKFQVGVQNPSSSAITLNSLFGKILIDGFAVGDVAAVIQQSIKGNSETVIPISITPDFFGSVGLLVQNITSGYQVPKSIELQASANIDNNIIPVKLQFV